MAKPSFMSQDCPRPCWFSYTWGSRTTNKELDKLPQPLYIPTPNINTANKGRHGRSRKLTLSPQKLCLLAALVFPLEKREPGFPTTPFPTLGLRSGGSRLAATLVSFQAPWRSEETLFFDRSHMGPGSGYKFQALPKTRSVGPGLPRNGNTSIRGGLQQCLLSLILDRDQGVTVESQNAFGRLCPLVF